MRRFARLLFESVTSSPLETSPHLATLHAESLAASILKPSSHQFRTSSDTSFTMLSIKIMVRIRSFSSKYRLRNRMLEASHVITERYLKKQRPKGGMERGRQEVALTEVRPPPSCCQFDPVNRSSQYASPCWCVFPARGWHGISR